VRRACPETSVGTRTPDQKTPQPLGLDPLAIEVERAAVAAGQARQGLDLASWSLARTTSRLRLRPGAVSLPGSAGDAWAAAIATPSLRSDAVQGSQGSPLMLRRH